MALIEAEREMSRLVRTGSLGVRHGMTRDNPRAVWPQHRKLTGQLEVGQHAQSTDQWVIRTLARRSALSRVLPTRSPDRAAASRARASAMSARDPCSVRPVSSRSTILRMVSTSGSSGIDERGSPPTGATPRLPYVISLQRGRDFIHCTAECPARTISASLCEALCTRAMTSQVACLGSRWRA